MKASNQASRGINLDLVIATTNSGKVREIEKLLADLPFQVTCHSLGKLGIKDHPEENGSTFKANAVIKAIHYSRKLPGRYVAAEDSGLVVAALSGKPGVHSARYAGKESDDAKNINKLLQKMTSREDRQAKFVTVVALARDGKTLKTFFGSVEGVITHEPMGSEGFGYDPVFLYPPMQKTFAQLTGQEKNHVSHRFHAFQQVKKFLGNLAQPDPKILE